MIKRLAVLLAPDAAPGSGGAPATPAAAAPPTPAPKTDATPAPASGGDDADPFDALDKRLTPKSRAADDAEKAKDKTEPKDKPADAPDDKAKAPADKTPPDASRKIESGPKALRDQLEKTNAELKTHRERVQSLETKIQEYESKGKDTTALAERLKTIEAEKEALQGQVSAFKKEASPEFIAKYVAPFSRAAEISKKVITQLTLAAKENEDGTTVAGRPATWDDFTRIYNLPYGQAQEEAERLFGKQERIVMSHYDKLHMMADEKEAAISEQRETWKKQEEKDKADAAVAETNKTKRIEEIGQLWERANADMVSKNPERYSAKPKDAEEAALVSKAYELWDAKPKTLLQQIAKDASIRNRIVSDTLAQHRLSKATERIAELETALNEAKGSKPGRTVRPGGQDAPTDKKWDADLMESMA